MPTTIPIEGATESPSSTVYYAARSSMDITDIDLYPAFESVDIISESVGIGLESIDIHADGTAIGLSEISIDNYSTYRVPQSIEVVSGDSFVILADLLAENLSGTNLGSFGFWEINAELKVNGDVVPIKSFDYQVPSGRLGSILNVRLARPDVSLVPAGAEIDFRLIVQVGGVESSYPLIANGKLQEREFRISYRGGQNAGPDDEVSFSSLDVISDKFGLAPRRPVVMFNPQRVRYDEVKVRNDQMVRDEHGRRIRPIVEPVNGLTMKMVLDRAYTDRGGFGFISAGSWGSYTWGGDVGTSGTEQNGCGFDAVVTNIQNYKVRRVDFTLEGGWHSGAQPVVAMYTPIYFVRDNVLFILDVERPLPVGISGHPIPLASHKVLSQRIEFKPDTNAVLLTYQYNGNDPNEDAQRQVREVFNDEVIDEQGTKGQAGYSKTTVRRWDREYYMSDAPDDVLDTFPLRSETNTEQTIMFYDTDGNEIGGHNRITHRETIEYQYEDDLKIRHIKTIDASIVDPGAGFAVDLVPIIREECNISWMEDPNNAGMKLQERSTTVVYGVCAYNPDATETLVDESGEILFSRMYPVLLAQSSGLLEEGWQLTGGYIPMSTVRMTLHKGKGNQFDVEVVEIDHINNTVQRSFTEPTTGTNSNDPFEAKSRTILLRDLDSEAEIGPRIPVGVNAYELPRLRAISLGRRVLYRMKNPLNTLPIQLAGVDFAIDRGSVVSGEQREDGYTSEHFVTGYTINGANLGKKEHRISQSLETIEIPPPGTEA